MAGFITTEIPHKQKKHNNGVYYNISKHNIIEYNNDSN